MKTSQFSENIFWSYKKNVDLPKEIITRQVILYGEVKDMILLAKQIDKKIIIQEIKKIVSTGRYNKRINFIKKIIL